MSVSDNKLPKNVFVYGSLMFEPVWERVVRGKYQCTPAYLQDHVRFGVVNELYPGVIAQQGSKVRGLVWLAVEQSDLALLDDFEGDDYQRTDVSLESDVGMRMPAQTYLWKDPARLTGQSWDLKHFAEEGLAEFLRKYVADWDRR